MRNFWLAIFIFSLFSCGMFKSDNCNDCPKFSSISSVVFSSDLISD